MGVCCETTNNTGQLTLSDLDVRQSTTSDIIEEWELKELPWSRCSFKSYEVLLKQAHTESGGNGFVSLEAMADKFVTRAWAPIRNKNSKLCELLLEYASHEEEKSSFDY